MNANQSTISHYIFIHIYNVIRYATLMTMLLTSMDVSIETFFLFPSDSSILIEESIRSLANQGKCKTPFLSHDAPEMMKFIKDEEPVDCGKEEDWVTCYMSMCVIKKHIIEQKGGLISCDFTDVLRIGDYKLEFGSPTRSTNRYLLQNSDFVQAKCKGADGSR